MASTRSFCRLCEVGCGSLVEVTERGVKVAPDPDNVYSAGYFCGKGLRADFLEDDPDRVRRPLIRNGNELEAASWSEALDVTGRRLRAVADRHGPESIGVFSGNSAAYSGHVTLAISRLLRGLGTDSIFSALSVDCISRYHTAAEAFNLMFATPVPLYGSVSGILLLGSNATVNQWSPGGATPGGIQVVRDLHRRGGWLGVVDPVRHPIARHADEFLSITPGTNATFLAGLLSYLGREGAIDDDYVTRHCQGLDEIVDRCEAIELDDVVSVCGVDAGRLRRIFAGVAEHRAAVLDRGGVTMSRNSTVGSGLTLAINAALGLFDVPNGFFIPDYSPVRGRASEGRPQGLRYGKEWPSAALAGAIDGRPPPGLEDLPQIKALISVAGNPARSLPATARLESSLRSLDLLVVIDLYVNDTARLADVVLPAASHYQKCDFNFLSGLLTPERYRVWSEGVVPLREQEKPDLWIADRLVAAFRDESINLDDDDFREFLVNRTEQPADEWAGGVVSPPDIGRYLEGGFPTDSGRIELDRGWAAGIADALRVERESATDPDTFAIVGRRLSHAVNSFLHNVPRFSSRGNPAYLSPEDAARLQVVEGDEVQLHRGADAVTVSVALSDDVPRGAISMSHGWGHEGTTTMTNAMAATGANANALTTDTQLDPYTGMPVYHGHRVRLTKPARPGPDGSNQ
jgi:anaerobic selenocysteine-containing dehydrogenase